VLEKSPKQYAKLKVFDEFFLIIRYKISASKKSADRSHKSKFNKTDEFLKKSASNFSKFSGKIVPIEK